MGIKKCKKIDQHVQVVHSMGRGNIIEPYDRLVCSTIMKFMNKDTREAYPSIKLLEQLIGSSSHTIRASIDKLSREYLKVTVRNNRNCYYFPKITGHFEPISFKFLEMKELSIQEKAFIIASQPYMFKDKKNWGKISFTRKELSKLINLSEVNIYRCEKSLTEKGFMYSVNTRKKDKETGCFIVERFFNMKALHQDVIWQTATHLEDNKASNKRVKQLQKELRMTRKLADSLGERVLELMRENGGSPNFLVM